ncbi:MAG: hypothetical protein KAJ28_06260 [Flavobacteriaceae bacterium]|nr:hypothetical protein [Flavobacteriaceae bacterium]
MISQHLALYNWNNGVIMIVIFGIVCLSLIATLIIFMNSGKKEKDKED